MKVIWLSLPDLNGNNRRQILEHLGYTTFGGLEIISNKQKYIDWNTYMSIVSDYDWNNFFEEANAIVLMAGHIRLKEFVQLNPDIKVIVEDVSYEQYSDDLNRYINFIQLLKKIKSTTRQAARAYNAGIKILKIIFSNDFSSNNIQSVMNTFEKDINTIIPEQQRLTIKNNEYDWKEICNFLDRPIPNYSIPRIKHSNSYLPIFKEILFKKFKRLWMWYLLYIIIIIGLFVITIT